MSPGGRRQATANGYPSGSGSLWDGRRRPRSRRREWLPHHSNVFYERSQQRQGPDLDLCLERILEEAMQGKTDQHRTQRCPQHADFTPFIVAEVVLAKRAQVAGTPANESKYQDHADYTLVY